jgi:hypothetical protein
MRAISFTRALVSRALASLARSCESFARRHGCVETWTLERCDAEAIAEGSFKKMEKIEGIRFQDILTVQFHSRALAGGTLQTLILIHD